MKKLTHTEFQELVKQSMDQTTIHYRLGQAMFNNLHESYNELANSIRGTDADPFYICKQENDLAFCLFYDAIVQVEE